MRRPLIKRSTFNRSEIKFDLVSIIIWGVFIGSIVGLGVFYGVVAWRILIQ